MQEGSIDCNGQRLGVTRNLRKALQNLRHTTETRVFWIDAICIDQKNIEERNSQVRLMREVYQKASEVVVWLGADKKDSAVGASMLPNIHAAALQGKLFQGPGSLEMRLEQAGLPGFDAPAWISLAEFYRRSWFMRIWVVQELALANTATVRCGGRYISWACFAPAAGCLRVAAEKRYWDARYRFDSNRFAYMDVCHTQFEKGTPIRLLDVLSATRGHFSTDPRDKVFAVLGLASDTQALFLDADYSKSTSEVYSALMMAMIADRGCLEILSHKEDPWFTGIKGLPSWVVDWSVHPRAQPLQMSPFYGHYRAAGDSQARIRRTTEDPNTLKIAGFRIDKVKECGYPLLRYAPKDNIAGNTYRRMNVSNYNYTTHMYLEQARWMQWERVALKLESYPDGEDPFEAYVRTLSGGLDLREDQSLHDLKFFYQAYLRMWDCLQQTGPIYCNAEASKDICTHFVWYRDAVENVAYGRLLFTSENGYMGLAPPSTRAGDLVCVLLGGRTPYILRPDGKGYYRLIGECYVHGQMNRNMNGIDNDLEELAIR